MAAGLTSTTAAPPLHPRRFLASIAGPPLLIVIRSTPIRISHGALRLPSPAFSGSSHFTPIRCHPNHSGNSNSPLNSVSEIYGRQEGNWFVVMDKPGGEGASRQEMVDCYVQTLARVVGSEEEAKKKIYMVLCEGDFGFGCVIDEEMKEKIKGLPDVRFVFHDLYAETGINKLKHSALDLSAEIESVLYFERKPVGRAEQKKQLEEAIESLESINSRFQAHKVLYTNHLILTQMDKVLYELSTNLNALWEEVGDSLRDLDLHRIVQIEKAIESLSLAEQAFSSLQYTGRTLDKMEEELKALSHRVGQLRSLPTKEAYTLSTNINECGPTHEASN